MTLSPFLGRTLAVVLLLGASGGIWSLIVEPVMTKYRLSAESTVQSKALIERYLRIAKVRAPLEKQLISLKRRGPSTGGYLEGASDTRAAAKLIPRERQAVGVDHGGGEANDAGDGLSDAERAHRIVALLERAGPGRVGPVVDGRERLGALCPVR